MRHRVAFSGLLGAWKCVWATTFRFQLDFLGPKLRLILWLWGSRSRVKGQAAHHLTFCLPWFCPEALLDRLKLWRNPKAALALRLAERHSRHKATYVKQCFKGIGRVCNPFRQAERQHLLVSRTYSTVGACLQNFGISTGCSVLESLSICLFCWFLEF